MKQLSRKDGARSIKKRVDTEYHMQSNSAFCHEADYRINEEPGAHLLNCCKSGVAVLLKGSAPIRKMYFFRSLEDVLKRSWFAFSTF